ncbi:unnamed protein product [Rotaria sp. Silwood2]|nr:unnamed protein product [Rotaria sp. Silwood2]CAF3270518.1 unnamed protein product [Rotaria sp. Silwood2]CAF4687861.1 unnamed protein product [Rotaria sp. Silwood2]
MLFNTVLPFALYGPPVAPVIIMCSTSIRIFVANFINNVLIIMILESTSILAGYVMIFIPCTAPKFEEHLLNWWSKFKGLFSNESHC